MIVITGAAGFIGSCMITKLNEVGYTDIILVDDFSKKEKYSNFENKVYIEEIDRKKFLYGIKIIQFIPHYSNNIDFVLHIGARTNTSEFNKKIFDKLNLNYSKEIWNFCTEFQIPLIYASSAASYGDGKLGYDDQDDSLVYKLHPLNPYGESKNEFDKWVLEQTKTPPNWYGLKFFNVFGPNEYHKGRMASVIYHAYNQIIETGKIQLFKSHIPEYKDGEQMRDFIYVKDVINVMYFFIKEKPISGIYNLGSGKSRTFIDLANAVFKSLNKESIIEYVDTPIDIRDNYQYFTEAKMDKLKSIGYNEDFYSLENAIDEYINKYLIFNLRH